MSADDTIFYSNQSFATMVGVPLERVIGSRMRQFVFVEDAARYATLMHEARAGASRGTIRLSKVGITVLTHLSVNPFESAGSASFSVVVADLTQCQRQEELLTAQAVERTKRADAGAAGHGVQGILESITDSFVTLDRNWRITDVNQRAAVAFGKTSDELIGKSFWDVTHRLHPDVDEQYRIAMGQRLVVHHDGPSIIAIDKWFERHIYPTDAGLAVYFRDITEGKRAEDRLLQSEAHFNEAQRLGHVGSWIWDVRTGNLVWSLEHYRLFGVDPETFRPTRENAQPFIHSEDRVAVQAVVDDAIRREVEFEVDYRIIRPDGSLRYHRGLGRPLVSNADEQKYVGTVMDVTDRKKTELALRQSEERFRRYFELGLIGMAITSPTKGILEVNDELCRILGYERVELLRKTWAEMTYPDDLSRDAAQFDRVMAGESDGYSMDKRWIRKDGGVIYSIMATRCVRLADRSVEYFVGLVQDITERKLAEEKLRHSEALLADGERISKTGSWVLSLRTGELSWSREHYSIWGVDPETFDLTLTSARHLIHPDDRDSAIDVFESALRSRTGFECEFRIVKADGDVRQMLSVARPMLDDAGDCHEYAGTVMDITDRKQEEVAREEIRRRLIEAQEDERRRIALEMHDEFGQQLSALALKLSGLRRDIGRRTALTGELELLEQIVRELDRDLENIVGRLRPTALDDLGLVAALTEYVKHWSEHFHVSAELQTSGMEADRLTNELETALYRIAQEVLNNVAKHARATHVSVLLDQRSDRVSVIVEDDGVGFDPEQPSARFGVAGMRDRARLLGGTVEIESHPGAGTTVAARIPLTSHVNRSPHRQGADSPG
jgi:PAS domain S-box-containing protein